LINLILIYLNFQFIIYVSEIFNKYEQCVNDLVVKTEIGIITIGHTIHKYTFRF